MKIIKINRQGQSTTLDLTRQELIHILRFHPRDIRTLLSQKERFNLFRRNDTVVAIFYFVKIVINKNNVFVFEDEQKKARSILVPRIKSNLKAQINERFEHEMLDAALFAILKEMQKLHSMIERTAKTIQENLGKELHDTTFAKMLTFKKQFAKLFAKTKDINETIIEILDDDDDISELVLKSHPTKDEFDTSEAILEGYIEQFDSLLTAQEEINENIDDTQEILTLKMASRRNKIIKYDLIISIIGALFAFLAVITGAFGMNLKNHLEVSSTAFLIVSLIMLLITFTLATILFSSLKKNKIL